jgi:hypothetical protein
MGTKQSQHSLNIDLNQKVVLTESSKKHPQVNGITYLPCSFMDDYPPAKYESSHPLFGANLRIDIRQRCEDYSKTNWELMTKDKYVNSVVDDKVTSLRTFQTSDHEAMIPSTRWTYEHDVEPNELAGVFERQIYGLRPFADGGAREVTFVNGQRCFPSSILKQYGAYTPIHRKLSEESS